MKIGLQAYTVRDALDVDFTGTLKKVKEMGYDGIELAGLHGKTVEEVRSSLQIWLIQLRHTSLSAVNTLPSPI